MSRVYLFRHGQLEVTVYPVEPGQPGVNSSWLTDVYHAGEGVLRPRFVCTGDEGLAVGFLARASADLVENYLTRGIDFGRWCRDRRLDPTQPDFTGRVSAEQLRAATAPLRVVPGR